jgi:16S rRNA (cytosine967-C5)-methyltransferase
VTAKPAIGRAIATRVLHRVAADAAWASPALDAEIERSRAGERDAALATEIVYGTLRALPSVDREIDRHRRKSGETEPFALAALRAGAYQLLHLSGAPSHAIVSDAVSLVRAQRGEGLAKFANAILRRVAASRPERPERPTKIELPRWLEQAIERGLGEARAAVFLGARVLPPPTTLRVTPGRIERSELAARIRAARSGADVREAALSPLGLLVRGAGDPRALPGWKEGLFAVQDEGSQLVALLAGAERGEVVADACAGRGGKTAVLAAAGAKVTAIDLHEPKLDRIAPELARLGLPGVETAAIDLSVGTGGLEGRFDRVLVDAPCTGIGTIHRRPELALRLAPTDPARMAELQRAIVGNAARLLRPGGTLVYAVCSPTREEGAEVVASLGAPLGEPVIGLAPDGDGIFRIGPFSAPDGPDAYQIARFSSRSAGEGKEVTG